MPATPATEEETTGYLDRCISEMFYLTEHPRDEITLQTLKHHAEDMILAGQEILRRIKKTKTVAGFDQGVNE